MVTNIDGPTERIIAFLTKRFSPKSEFSSSFSQNVEKSVWGSQFLPALRGPA